MIGRRSVFAAVVAVATLSLAGCELFADSSTVRFRVTVEVDTPEGMRSGSSVLQVKITENLGPASTAFYYQVKGEAVAVDLPGRQTLFALFNDRAPDILMRHVATVAKSQGRAEWHWQKEWPRLNAEKPSFELPHWAEPSFGGRDAPMVDLYPRMVKFREAQDPKSVEMVDPDKLAASFGPGVKLRRITIQITDDPVTTGIEQRLPWLSGYYDRSFSGNRFSKTNSLPDNLYLGSFSTEIKP